MYIKKLQLTAVDESEHPYFLNLDQLFLSLDPAPFQRAQHHPEMTSFSGCVRTDFLPGPQLTLTTGHTRQNAEVF